MQFNAGLAAMLLARVAYWLSQLSLANDWQSFCRSQL